MRRRTRMNKRTAGQTMMANSFAWLSLISEPMPRLWFDPQGRATPAWV